MANLGQVVGMNIPTYVVDQHDESLEKWRSSNIKDAAVLHIDAHSDMEQTAEFDYPDGPFYSGISNFLSVASYENIIGNLYWLNPHHSKSSDFRLQYLGSKSDSNNSLGTHLEEICDEVGILKWDDENHGGDIYAKINDADLKNSIKDKPFILDIDLDAFCASVNYIGGKIVHNLKDPNYNGVLGWKTRIDETVDLLKNVGRIPDIITISRSTHNMNDMCSWVPLDKVDEVQDYVVNQLRNLYQDKKR